MSHAPTHHTTPRSAAHGHVCPCSHCVLNRDLRDSQTRVVHESPSSSLPDQSVSALEVLQDWQLRELRKTLDDVDYSVGEDWNDD